jgi:hypothetical protein
LAQEGNFDSFCYLSSSTYDDFSWGALVWLEEVALDSVDVVRARARLLEEQSDKRDFDFEGVGI